jgi:serine/threonine protein kinase
MAEFERIRVVGKGAYGRAVLYRKRESGAYVILKEINLLELTPAERNMAFNEAKVLRLFDHDNIIRYYDCFEEEGLFVWLVPGGESQNSPSPHTPLTNIQ